MAKTGTMIRILIEDSEGRERAFMVECPPMLKAWSTKQRITAKKIAADFAGKVELDSGFEGREFTLIFPADLLKEIAVRLGARRRRQLSPEQKEKAVANLKKFQFKPARKSVPTAQDERSEG